VTGTASSARRRPSSPPCANTNGFCRHGTRTSTCGTRTADPKLRHRCPRTTESAPSRPRIPAICPACGRQVTKRVMNPYCSPYDSFGDGRRSAAAGRKIVTEIPGPKSRELEARRQSAVATGVGSALPAYVVAGGGGILKDADGNQLIDLGAGIAVTTAGNSNPRVVE